MQYFKGILVVFLGLLLTACSSHDSPKGIAKSFWDGVLAQDEAVVKQYSSAASQTAIDFTQNKIDWKQMAVKLGATDINGDNATVHTEVTNTTTEQQYIFSTYLVRENDAWRVDYVRTRQASATSEVFSELVKSLHKLNQSLTENYDATVVGFTQASPAIKVELDRLSDNLSNHGTTAETHPTLHDRLEALKIAIKDMFTHHEPASAPAAKPAEQPAH